MRRRIAVPVLALALLAVPAAASAGWSASAGGSATAAADRMTNATDVTAACTNKSGSSSVTLRWKASPDPYVTGYRIVRTSTSGASLTILVVGGTATSYTDLVVAATGQTFSYTIEATSTGTAWRTPPSPAAGRPSYTRNSCTTL